MSWTDERVETLKRMWAEGLSASQIAKDLGGVTRNAVIGKVHRLGLSNRTEGGEAPAAAAPAAEQQASATASAAAPSTARGKAAANRPSRPDAAAATPGRSAPVEPDPQPEPMPDSDRPDFDRPDPAVEEPDERDDPATGPDRIEADADDSDGASDGADAPARAFNPSRRPIVPAGQPLPPQPSANEISPEALASVREVEKKARKLTLMELTERTCKWPIGDPATDKFWFCGLPSQAGKPYCEAHVGVAFQPMSARRDRRR